MFDSKVISAGDTSAALQSLWQIGFNSIRELESERGIFASGRNEVFGCVFGRDSLITSLSLLRVYEKTRDEYFLDIVEKVLFNLSELQGKTVNIESGEEPGKCIHEFRPSNHEHLTQMKDSPWYVYPDNIMRNYDSVDSTSLYLLTMYEYHRLSGNDVFVLSHMSNIKAALDWLHTYGDSNGDGFIDYRFPPERIHGGLKTQSWMDSTESLFHEDDTTPEYPIAPVEVQAYTFAALSGWSMYFKDVDNALSDTLSRNAALLKQRFNDSYVLKRGGKVRLAFALDGNGRPLLAPRSSMGHVLWAVSRSADNSSIESVLDSQHIPAVVERLFRRDLFVPNVGMRTLSSKSDHFDPDSYHNGSIWPHDTAIVAEGMENFGFGEEAKEIRKALLNSYSYFDTPVELFVYKRGKYREYQGPNGQGACRTQAWSAASLLTTINSLPAFA